MKNTIRVRENRRAFRTSSQAKISPNAEEQPAEAVPKYVLSLIEWVGNRTLTVAEIDVSRSEFEMLTKEDVCPNELLKRGLDLMLEPKSSCELENAMLQSNALAMMLYENMDYNRLNGGNFSSNGTRGDCLSAGVQQLVWQTQNRLTKATNAPEANRAEVAS